MFIGKRFKWLCYMLSYPTSAEDSALFHVFIIIVIKNN